MKLDLLKQEAELAIIKGEKIVIDPQEFLGLLREMERISKEAREEADDVHLHLYRLRAGLKGLLDDKP